MLLALIYAFGEVLAVIGIALSCYVYSTIDDYILDHINSREACKSANFIVPYNLAIQLALTLLFIWHPYLFFWNLGMMLFDGWRVTRRGRGLTWWTSCDPSRILTKRQSDCIALVAIVKITYYGLSAWAYCVLAFHDIYYGSSFQEIQ